MPIETTFHMPQFMNWMVPPIRECRDRHDDDETTSDPATDVMPDSSEEVIFSEQQCFDQVFQTAADSLDLNDSTEV
jgi:hypothetical protein